MRYILFIHMLIKNLPKFPFLKDKGIRKNINWQNQFQLKIFDSSVIIIIDGTNKDRVAEVEKKDWFIICDIYRFRDFE